MLRIPGNVPSLPYVSTAALFAGLLSMSACASGADPDDAGTEEDSSVRDSSVRDTGRDTSRPDTMPPVEGQCDGMANGTTCDADSDGCTEDTCQSGECVAGERIECGDELACTLDACQSTGPMSHECVAEVASVACLIDGSCIMNGEFNPENSCQVCNRISGEADDWTLVEGACDDGDACTVRDTCVDGACVGSPIAEDIYEPNNSNEETYNLGEVDDNESFPKGVINGTLFPEGDEDWFVYTDNDASRFAFIYPRVELRDIPEGSDYDVCAYIVCPGDEPPDDISCRSGSVESFMWTQGCCSRNTGSANEDVYINHSCPGRDDTADVYVRVTRVSGGASCEGEYRLRWGDD